MKTPREGVSPESTVQGLAKNGPHISSNISGTIVSRTTPWVALEQSSSSSSSLFALPAQGIGRLFVFVHTIIDIYKTPLPFTGLGYTLLKFLEEDLGIL